MVGKPEEVQQGVAGLHGFDASELIAEYRACLPRRYVDSESLGSATAAGGLPAVRSTRDPPQ
jgi:hypothetical protein